MRKKIATVTTGICLAGMIAFAAQAYTGNVLPAVTVIKNEIDWVAQSNEIDQLTLADVNDNSAYTLCEKYLDLLARDEISLSDYTTIINKISTKFSSLGMPFDKSTYLYKGQYRQYMTELKSGKYDNLVKTLASENQASIPKGLELTSSQKLILEMAKHVGSRWANGIGISGGTNLRYSQTMYPKYTSDLTGETYTVRPDCSGFIYTVLRELGCTEFQNYSSVPNTQTFTGLAGSGELALDPRLEVIPFSPEALQPGDIMVASKNERLTCWGTNIPYVTADGYPIRKGHTEIFVRWVDPNASHTVTTVTNVAPQAPQETEQNTEPQTTQQSTPQTTQQTEQEVGPGYVAETVEEIVPETPEESAQSDALDIILAEDDNNNGVQVKETTQSAVMEVYSWGSTGQVETSFVNANQYTPLNSTKAYNYSYIIRWRGGYDLWQ